MTTIPKGLRGPNADGLVDPESPTIADRQTRSVARLQADDVRSRSLSPLLRRLAAISVKFPLPTRGLGR